MNIKKGSKMCVEDSTGKTCGKVKKVFKNKDGKVVGAEVKFKGRKGGTTVVVDDSKGKDEKYGIGGEVKFSYEFIDLQKYIKKPPKGTMEFIERIIRAETASRLTGSKTITEYIRQILNQGIKNPPIDLEE